MPFALIVINALQDDYHESYRLRKIEDKMTLKYFSHRNNAKLTEV